MNTSDLFGVVANIVALLIFIALLYGLGVKKYSFTQRIFTGLVIGIAWGFCLQYKDNDWVMHQTNDWYNILAGGYIRLLQMIIMPLIVVSIISAIINLKSTQGLGRMSALVLGFLLFTTALSAAVGIAAALGFNLSAMQMPDGSAALINLDGLNHRVAQVQSLSLPQEILGFIPVNPFADLTGARTGSTLGVVLFSALIGLAALLTSQDKPQQANAFKQGMNALHAVVMRLVNLILRLTPYAILAIMANTVAQTRLQELYKLSGFIVASYAAIIGMFVLHLLLLALHRLNPCTFLRKSLPTLIFAFTARSSAAALPLNIQAQTQKLGVSEGLANLSASFGISIGQNGCAGIYPAMLAVMIAPTVGVDPTSITFICSLIGLVMISSFGVAGVGGGATFASLIVLSALNFPIALVGLLISVEPIIDMARTALNVSGSMTTGLLSSKWMNELDTNQYQAK